jgi:ribonuclease P protein subunit RPR2
MGKAKSSKSDGSNVPQRHLHSRLSFLHQAATLLSNTNPKATPAETDGESFAEAPSVPMRKVQACLESTRLLNHLRGVSRKSQVRLAPRMKHTLCKRCDCLLIAGRTSSGMTVNPSKNGSKPWADTFEVRCNRCGTVKRFPVGANRQDDRAVEGSEQRGKKEKQLEDDSAVQA